MIVGYAVMLAIVEQVFDGELTTMPTHSVFGSRHQRFCLCVCDGTELSLCVGR